MNFFTKEVKIGLTAILAVAMVYCTIIFMKGITIFGNDSLYYVEMSDVSGLGRGSEVYASGMKIGSVNNITYNQDTQNLTVELAIDKNFVVPQGTTVYISKEMLGSPKINLRLGPAGGSILPIGGKLTAEKTTDIMSAAADMVPQLQALLPKLDSILSGVNQLVADPAISASLHNAEYITAGLKETTDNINGLLGKDVPQLLTRVNNISANAETFTNELNNLDLNGIASNANSTISTFNLMANNLNNAMQSKDNSLGYLLNDNSLALQLDSTAQNASLLLEDLRLHPKRYVHFSIFGKKDK